MDKDVLALHLQHPVAPQLAVEELRYVVYHCHFLLLRFFIELADVLELGAEHRIFRVCKDAEEVEVALDDQDLRPLLRLRLKKDRKRVGQFVALEVVAIQLVSGGTS